MDQEEVITKLLRLKRYEQPPEGFHEEFLRDFHKRQRAAALKTGPWKTLWGAICDIWPDYQVPQWAYAGCAAVAIAAGVFLHAQSDKRMSASASPLAGAPPAAVEWQRPSLIGNTIPVSTAGSRHYVLEPKPSSADSPLSF